MDHGPASARLLLRRGLSAYISTLALTAFVLSFRAFALGRIGLIEHLLGGVFALYIIAMGCHDAIHHALHPRRWLNDLLGWIMTPLVGGPFWVYKRAHLAHHARSDQPDDPERWAYAHGPLLPLCWITGNLSYYAILREAPRREWVASAALLLLAALGCWLWPRELLLGWVLPMQIATSTFAFATVFLPHGPWREFALSRVPLVTGYHLSHHARPAYPWHQYHSLTRALAAQAEAREAEPTRP